MESMYYFQMIKYGKEKQILFGYITNHNISTIYKHLEINIYVCRLNQLQ